MTESTSLYSSLLTLLLRLHPYARGPIFRRIYWALYGLWESDGPPVRTNLHGFSVLVNRGNIYPFLIRGCPQFNAPLVELVQQMSERTKLPLTFVDVGAATGDTVLLIKERCSGMVKQFICVEGDSEFHRLLSENMRQFTDVTVVNALLAAEPKRIRSLVKHHKGTAIAAGEDMVEAICLDSIVPVINARVDILKIDVDGFDGEVLSGASSTLRRWRPAVIFEWHPRLVLAASNDPFRAFDALDGCGYTRYAWFNNNGTFSHFSGSGCREAVSKQQEYLLSLKDQHYDIVALHPDSILDEVSLAKLCLANSNKC